MTHHLDIGPLDARAMGRVRSSERPWLAVAVLAMALGAIALGAFVFGLSGGMMQTASTTPAPMTDGMRAQ
jgi:hypothetical protein